jgi:hypothetical protein
MSRKLTKKQEQEIDNFVDIATPEQIDEFCKRLIKRVHENE